MNIIIRDISNKRFFENFIARSIVPQIQYKKLSLQSARRYITDKLIITFIRDFNLNTIYIDQIDFDLKDACTTLADSIVALIVDNYNTIPTLLSLFGYPENEISPIVFQTERLLVRDFENKLSYVPGMICVKGNPFTHNVNLMKSDITIFSNDSKNVNYYYTLVAVSIFMNDSFIQRNVISSSPANFDAFTEK